MKKLTIEIDEKYGGVLSITAVGSNHFETCVSTKVIDLSKCNFLSIGEDGEWTAELKEA